MTKRRSLAIGSALAFLTCTALGACSDEKKEEEHHEGGHTLTSPSCVELSETCHEADTGSGAGHDCHETAHADVEADCAAELASCTATCEAIIADGGM